MLFEPRALCIVWGGVRRIWQQMSAMAAMIAKQSQVIQLYVYVKTTTDASLIHPPLFLPSPATFPCVSSPCISSSQPGDAGDDGAPLVLPGGSNYVKTGAFEVVNLINIEFQKRFCAIDSTLCKKVSK